MTIEKFNKMLEAAELRKKDFAELTGLSYGSVTNWGQEKKPVPKWVESWLKMYIENKHTKQIVSAIRNSGLCDDF